MEGKAEKYCPAEPEQPRVPGRHCHTGWHGRGPSEGAQLNKAKWLEKYCPAEAGHPVSQGEAATQAGMAALLRPGLGLGLLPRMQQPEIDQDT